MLLMLTGLFALAYISTLVVAVVTLAHQPTFQSSKNNFDLRHKYGEGTMLVTAKQSIKWEEPEAYIHVYSQRQEYIRPGIFHIVNM